MGGSRPRNENESSTHTLVFNSYYHQHCQTVSQFG